MVLFGIVNKSGLNSRSSAYGASHELQSHNRGNLYKVLINELSFISTKLTRNKRKNLAL